MSERRTILVVGCFYLDFYHDSIAFETAAQRVAYAAGELAGALSISIEEAQVAIAEAARQRPLPSIEESLILTATAQLDDITYLVDYDDRPPLPPVVRCIPLYRLEKRYNKKLLLTHQRK